MTRTVSRLAGVSALALVLTAAALTSGSGALATTVGPTKAVSYTHLDVYKRQCERRPRGPKRARSQRTAASGAR